MIAAQASAASQAHLANMQARINQMYANMLSPTTTLGATLGGMTTKQSPPTTIDSLRDSLMKAKNEKTELLKRIFLDKLANEDDSWVLHETGGTTVIKGPKSWSIEVRHNHVALVYKNQTIGTGDDQKYKSMDRLSVEMYRVVLTAIDRDLEALAQTAGELGPHTEDSVIGITLKGIEETTTEDWASLSRLTSPQIPLGF